MKTTQLNQYFIKGLKLLGLAFLIVAPSGYASAQDIAEVRWKSESQVRALYGEPKSISSPVGTHASYTMWKYEDFTVAFANKRAFHLFDKDSLKKLQLEENRDDSS
ncbi:MAG: hypothetical protein ACI9FR_001091 [Cryomorphaceae bacterium]|jgi:hypothetical protein